MADEGDILLKIRSLQKKAGETGRHGYSSLLAEAAREIEWLREAPADAAIAAVGAHDAGEKEGG